MPRRQITEESIKAMAAMVGLELSDERVAELLPQVQRAAELAAENETLDLTDVEPAFRFDPERL
jgi:Asp-tRNA(Asn)/Glu-tRNA(Gln) amidotransferase C subunit